MSRSRRGNAPRLEAIAFLALIVASAQGCSTQGLFVRLGDVDAPPLSEDYEVEVFKDAMPQRQYIEVARLHVHREVTHFIRSNLDDLLPELQRQARKAGCHAVFEIEERRSRIGETMVYHVIATGIRYTEPENR